MTRTSGKTAARGLAIAALFFASSTGLAQTTASGHVALQGTYIEVGVNHDGFFGFPAVEVPEGYHSAGHDGGNGLGFVADYRKNGWTDQYGGDFFTPGSPFEGFMIKWGPSDTGTLFSNDGDGDADMATDSLVDTSAGTVKSVVWTGKAHGADGEELTIVQTYRFDQDALFFTANVQLINTGTLALSNLRFVRNVDPDNDVTWNGDFETHNVVVSNPTADSSQAVVTATGLTVTDMTLGLGAIDARARVTADGQWENDPDLIMPAGVDIPTDVTDDTTIALVFTLGDLAPGQSATFDYAYVLSADDVSNALGSLAAVTILQPSGTVSGSAVPFQAKTDDMANTTQVAFYVNDTLIHTVTTPVNGAFSTTFDSTGYADGALSLKVVATVNGNAVEKTATVLVDNAGPPMQFSAPNNGDLVNGATFAVTVTGTDAGHSVLSVHFYREVAGQPTVDLGNVAESPFTVTMDVTDLVDGTPVTIRAVGVDGDGKVTNLTVATVVGTPVTPPPPAPSSSSGGCGCSNSGGGGGAALLLGLFLLAVMPRRRRT